LNARTATRIGQLLLPCRNEYFDVTGLATTDGSAPIVPTRIQCFRSKYDHLRSAVVNEPPGSDAVVGRLDLRTDRVLVRCGCGAPCDLDTHNLEVLSDYTAEVRKPLTANGIMGANGNEIDHIEISADPEAYPLRVTILFCVRVEVKTVRRAAPARAPSWRACTPTVSLRKAILTGRREYSAPFSRGRVTVRDNNIFPQITGRAYITSYARLVIDDRDPFKWGIRF
jgi:4-hydroxyproline epimerase